MSTHTPGPWIARKYRYDIVEAPDTGHVAICETSEDARLIAASPDLLKAAQDLLADVRRRYPGEELRCPYMRALDAAAAKAEGRSP